MPRIKSIFENADFIDVLFKVGQAPNLVPNLQLALNLVNSLTGLPAGQIAPNSLISVPGGITDKNQPTQTDLSSLSAFVDYLLRNNFKYGGSPGGTGIDLVAPATVDTFTAEGYVKFTDKISNKVYQINKNGIIEILKTLGSQAATSNNQYLQELANKLISDILSDPQFDLPKDIFTEQKSNLNALPNLPGKPGEMNDSTEKHRVDNRGMTPTSTQSMTQSTDMTVEDAVKQAGFSDVNDWFPFYPGIGLVSFDFIRSFILGLITMAKRSPIASEFARIIDIIYQYRTRFEQTIVQFNSSAPPSMQASESFTYALGKDPTAAQKDFEALFPMAPNGALMAPGTGYDMVSQINVASSGATACQIVVELLQLVKNIPALSSKINDIDAQIETGNKLNERLKQLAGWIQSNARDLRRPR